MKAVDGLLLRVSAWRVSRQLSSLVWPTALAAEKLVKLRSISKDRCLVHRLGALIPWRHLASLVQGTDRAGVQILRQRRWLFSVPRNGARWGYH